VVTETFNNGSDTGVTDCETLGSDTPEEASTGSGTVQADIANNHILLSLEDRRTGRVDNQTTT
jgi:hypothetical protein